MSYSQTAYHLYKTAALESILSLQRTKSDIFFTFRTGGCEPFGKLPTAVFQTHSEFQTYNHLNRNKSFCPLKYTIF